MGVEGAFLNLAAPGEPGEQDAGPRLGLFQDCSGRAQVLRYLRTKSPCVDTFVFCFLFVKLTQCVHLAAHHLLSLLCDSPVFDILLMAVWAASSSGLLWAPLHVSPCTLRAPTTRHVCARCGVAGWQPVRIFSLNQ